MSLMARLYAKLFGQEVGRDSAGNRYYRLRGGRIHPDSLRRERRWVIYNGEVEASRVPAEWHAWLHYLVEEPPSAGSVKRYPWQKEHQANMTGTPLAYRPPGHPLKGGERARGTGDYEAWTPR